MFGKLLKPSLLIAPLIALSTTLPGQAQEAITTDDGFELMARIWEQDRKSDLMLLLHQCDADQSMYEELAEQLFDAGFHVLSFDYRGQGLSINEDFDENTVTDNRAFRNRLDQYARSDLDAVMKYSKLRLGRKQTGVSLLGASCGGNKAIYLAEQYRSDIRSIGFLSSRLSGESMDKLSEFNQIPMLFIAATGDKRAYESALNTIEGTSSDRSKIIVYHGTAHAKALFGQDVRLTTSITHWYSELSK